MHRLALSLLLMLAMAGCSLRGAMESLTSPEDRAFAQEMVTRLRGNDQDWLRARFSPELWAQSEKQLAEAAEMYPAEPVTTEITSFNIATNTTNGMTERSKEFTLVTHGGGRWAVTSFSTRSAGGPDLVVSWRVVPHATEPPELRMLNAVDAALPWAWGGALLVVLGIGGLIFWLVRRSRRKHRDPLAGRTGPTDAA